MIKLKQNESDMTDEEVATLLFNTTSNENKNNQLMMYDRTREVDIPLYNFINELSIDEYLNNKYEFFMTINPKRNKSEDKIKDEFNFIKNQYGYFLYGKNYPRFLNFKYYMAVEKSDYDDLRAFEKYEYFKNHHQNSIINNTHLHIIWHELTIPDIYGLQTYIYNKYVEYYPNVSIYTKICDSADPLIYAIKKNDTELLNQDYFIKEEK